MFVCEVTHELQESRTWKDEASVGGIGLGDNGGNLVSVFSESFFELFGIVVGKGDSLVGEALGDSC